LIVVSSDGYPQARVRQRELTLEIAGLRLGVTCECNFRTLCTQETGDLLVGDIADLVILVYHLTVLVADASLSRFHHRVACIV
jgi:hypothetical protein